MVLEVHLAALADEATKSTAPLRVVECRALIARERWSVVRSLASTHRCGLYHAVSSALLSPPDHDWLDSWAGVGMIVAGMAHQGWDLQLAGATLNRAARACRRPRSRLQRHHAQERQEVASGHSHSHSHLSTKEIAQKACGNGYLSVLYATLHKTDVE